MIFITRRTKPYRWLVRFFCCKTVSQDASHKMLRNQRTFTSSTITTSLTSSSARSTSVHRPNKIVNFEQSAMLCDTNGRWQYKTTYHLYAWDRILRCTCNWGRRTKSSSKISTWNAFELLSNSLSLSHIHI